MTLCFRATSDQPVVDQSELDPFFAGWTAAEIADYVAYCERQSREMGDDLSEDYPGQRISGPDFDTREFEGVEDEPLPLGECCHCGSLYYDEGERQFHGDADCIGGNARYSGC
jgi:hypothetical protein